MCITCLHSGVWSVCVCVIRMFTRGLVGKTEKLGSSRCHIHHFCGLKRLPNAVQFPHTTTSPFSSLHFTTTFACYHTPPHSIHYTYTYSTTTTTITTTTTTTTSTLYLYINILNHYSPSFNTSSLAYHTTTTTTTVLAPTLSSSLTFYNVPDIIARPFTPTVT